MACRTAPLAEIDDIVRHSRSHTDSSLMFPHPQAIALPITPISPTSQEYEYPLNSNLPLSIRIVKDFLVVLYSNNAGLLLIAASQLFLTFMNLSVKFLKGIDQEISTLELVFVRMVITYCCCVTYMIVRKVPHALLGPPEVRHLLIFRGMSGFFGLFGIYYSLQYLSLSDAIVLTFLSPTTTAIAGFFVLHEHLSRKEIAAGAFSFLGVILIARPQSFFGSSTTNQVPNTSDLMVLVDDEVTSAQRIIAVCVSMLGVAGATGSYISLRAIGERAHVMHSMSYFSLYSVFVSTIGMILFRIKFIVPSRLSWCGVLLSIGVTGFSGQILLARGLQRETASRGTLALYTQLLFATVLERLFFGTVPSLLSIFGTAIIMSSAIYIAINRKRQNAPENYQPVPRTSNDTSNDIESDLQGAVDLENISPRNDSDYPRAKFSGV